MYAQMVKSEATKDDPAQLAAFQARIDAGEKIEPKDWMPEGYRKTLIRQVGQHARWGLPHQCVIDLVLVTDFREVTHRKFGHDILQAIFPRTAKIGLYQYRRHLLIQLPIDPNRHHRRCACRRRLSLGPSYRARSGCS